MLDFASYVPKIGGEGGHKPPRQTGSEFATTFYASSVSQDRPYGQKCKDVSSVLQHSRAKCAQSVQSCPIGNNRQQKTGQCLAEYPGAVAEKPSEANECGNSLS